MATNDLPNGFTGFGHRRAGFVSAADAIRARENKTQAQAAAREQRADEPEAASAPRLRPLGAMLADNSDRPPLRPFDEAELEAIDQRDRRWAWLEIDLGAIRHNVVQTRRRLKRGTRLLAVVKADAYGHGAVRVAETALNSGADYLAVATVPEGIELRRAGITAPILVLAQPPATSIPLLLAYDIYPAVYDAQFAIQYGEVADSHGMKAPFHLAVNTGMNRIGVRYDEVASLLTQIAFHRALVLEGVFTHFATADCPETLDFDIQSKRFAEAVDSIRALGIDPGIVHCANSAAIFRYPQVHYDMVRLGISLYGYYACPEMRSLVELKPAMSVHARITDTRLVPTGEGVSYGLHYRSAGSVKICTVPLGYADGLRRGLSGNTYFIVDGKLCRQVGNICMDQCMFEVDLRSYGTHRRIDPQVGDEVIIAGQKDGLEVSIDELADKLDTIQHEITIGFAQRLPRIYV
ncbi:MAG: alanine racemase [Eggerthellaceae bacterium]|jgi:alanine racemase